LHWLQPGHSDYIKDIKISELDNKVFSLGQDGMIIEFELLDTNMKDMYKAVCVIDEYLINKDFLQEIDQEKLKIHEKNEKEKRDDEERFKQQLNEKDRTMKEVEYVHKAGIEKLDDTIFELKETNSSIEIKHDEILKKNKEEHKKLIGKVEEELKRVKDDLLEQIKNSEVDKDTKISEKNNKQRSLSNN